jgi:hypothetical protein
MRVTMAIGVGLLGFVAVFAAVLMIGVSQTTSAGCDGVCLQKLDEIVVWASVAAGVVGFLAGRLFWRYLRPRE